MFEQSLSIMEQHASIGSIHDCHCQCAPGFTGSKCQTDTLNDCNSNPCQNGGTCSDNVTYFTCQCASGFTGSHCETNISRQIETKFSDNANNCTGSPSHLCSNQTIETPASYMMMVIVIVVAVIIIIISTILVVVCIRQRNKTRKSNDAELASRYETRNTSVLDNHIYSDIIRGSDGQDNIGADGRQPAGQESMIYEHVV